MNRNTILLPSGHKWITAESAGAQFTEFQCSKCGAEFCHDSTDNSTSEEDGDGSCDEND